MTTWKDGYLLAIDTETTGTDPDLARIVTAAAIVLGPGRRDDHEWMAKPDIVIPQGAIDIHGITNDMAQRVGRPTVEVLGELLEFLATASKTSTPVVGHNVVYDLTVIDREARRHGLTMPALGPVIDTMVLDKHVWPFRKGSRRLVDVCALHGISLDNAHDSTADAYGSARLAHRIACIAEQPEAHRPDYTRDGSQRNQYWEDVLVDVVGLHAAQVIWKKTQAASLQEYFRRKDPEAIVSGDWPVQSLPADWSPTAVPDAVAVAS
jgi:DNA polymerase-3 subunit epsilon